MWLKERADRAQAINICASLDLIEVLLIDLFFNLDSAKLDRLAITVLRLPDRTVVSTIKTRQSMWKEGG